MIEVQCPNIKNTIAALIHNCKNSIKHLNQIHSKVITSSKLTSDDRSFLISRLIFNLCTNSHLPQSLRYATKIFNRIPNPSLFTFNSMIRGHAGETEEPVSSFGCFFLYKKLLSSGLVPDSITLPFVLKQCIKGVDLSTGWAVHGHVVRFGLVRDVYVGNNLISLYVGCGRLSSAWKVFDEMCERDVVSWNSMIVGCLRGGEIDSAFQLFRDMDAAKSIVTWNSLITGLVQCGRAKEALDIFHEMQATSLVRPDKMTIASVLSACASLGAVDHGRWVHSYLERSGLEHDVVIETALVDMYGKCGCVEKAFEVFKETKNKDLLAWTAMISVFALHGYGNKAFEVFKEMEDEGVRPNAVTFVSLLSACAHAGLVEKARWCFDVMRSVYHIKPQIEHFACMVDILGRAGHFLEAEKVISTMPMSPDVYVWGALLGGCQLHGNVELGERIARYLIHLDPQNHSFYVILCDLYAKAGKFEDQKQIRSLMNAQEVSKSAPGSSMIEIDGVVYEFSVKGSPEIMLMEALKSVLMLLSNEMKIENDVNGIIW